jgi:hypothetical protein
MEKLLDRITAWLGGQKQVITDMGSPYLSRWILCKNFLGREQRLVIHCFHRSDADREMHDHPWSYWSLILWGGYWEETPAGRKWYGLGSWLRRPATWRHRVELEGGRKCWTLFWTSANERRWGFWCPSDWIPWKVFVARKESGLSGCG